LFIENIIKMDTEQPKINTKHIYIATDGACSANGADNAKASYGFVTGDISCVPKIKGLIMSSNMYKTVIKTIIDRELKTQDAYFAQNGLVPEENNIKPSNNRGELCGIKYALDYITQILSQNKDEQQKYSFTIVSDSAYSIGAVNVWGANWLKDPSGSKDKKNTDIIFPLVAVVAEIRKTATLDFKHVRSHLAFNSSLSELDLFLWILNFHVDGICTEVL